MTTQTNTEPLKVGDEPEYDYDLHALIRTTGLVSNSDCYDLVDLIRTKYIPKQMPSTEPSPADVTRYGCTTGGMEEQEDGDYVLYCDYRQATQQSHARVEGELTDEEIWTIVHSLDASDNNFWINLARAIERVLNQRLAVKEGEAVGDISKANWPFPYDKTFKAIGNAVHIEGGNLAISVMKFREAFGPLSTHPVSDDQQAKDAALWRHCVQFGFPVRNQTASSDDKRWIAFSALNTHYATTPYDSVCAALSATKQEK